MIAGVQKGGTTALHHFLKNHYQVFLSYKKELHFFDNEGVNWSSPKYDEQYHHHFSDACPTQICGEATPIYTYWPPSMARIYAYNPDVKLIVLLRDPVVRAYSHWRMETERGSETLTFSQCIREGRNRMKSGSEYDGFHRVFSYVERGFYANQLERIFSYFPHINVLLLDQRRFVTNHDATLNDVCDFLSIKGFSELPKAEPIFSHQPNSAYKINPDIDDADYTYLMGLYADDLKILHETYGIDFTKH